MMSKQLTQEEAEKKSLEVNIQMVGQYKLSNTKTQFKCPFCNNIFNARPNHIWRKKIKSCGCYSTLELHRRCWKGSKDISGDYFRSIHDNAKKRNIEFNITIEYLQKLLEQQDYKCSLSNLDILCSKSRKKTKKTYSEQTASLDRIDSSKGYIEKNVQWLHKDINHMKKNFSVDLFKKYCILVANY